MIFLLSSNLGELMTMFVAVALGLASPLKSSHILWINLITDSLPALALGVDKMTEKPDALSSKKSSGESVRPGRNGLYLTLWSADHRYRSGGISGIALWDPGRQGRIVLESVSLGGGTS